ncbi:threonine/serine ThrE exporter family protein [Anaerostipes sp. MSJ-23]|uniref:threonine/serine ThrE exporter family protein n=1 Tax=Anaerostipes sp. MSJ-23 TaxID=2841520 RepID=UPI001C114B09|nr:threonine/serine exporter family protein [Anaerostipes sp. MSJ-23]MBU5458956.1 threonine/serine exporter family protein [Anaerostipes sp. MSJ-23]
MKLKKVLAFAMDIGEGMLISGAGVSRVEDTITRICLAYGAKKADVFSITSSIVTSIEDADGEILTQTKRIRHYKTDFKKLDEFNQLSRYMCRDLPNEKEVKQRIQKIKTGRINSFMEEVLTSAAIATAWTIFYGGGIAEGAIAILIGGAVTVLSRYLSKLTPNEMVLNFLLSFFVAALAYLSARFGITKDYGKIIIGNIMLLVPGVAFVNALRDMIGGDMMSGILRVCESVLLAVFLAAGSFMALVFLGGVWQ